MAEDSISKVLLDELLSLTEHSKRGAGFPPGAILIATDLVAIHMQLKRIADALESIIDDKAKDGGKAARIRRVWEE